MLLSVKFLSPFPSYYSYIGHAAIYFRIYKSLEKLIISLRTQSGEIERERIKRECHKKLHYSSFLIGHWNR